MEFHRYISLDTETTGLSPLNDRICEIAAIEFNPITFEVLRKFHVYLNPEKHMPDRAYQIHGLSDSFLKDKPVFKNIAHEFIDFVSGANLYIHNARYDQGMLDAELARAGFKPLEHYVENIHCTLKIARLYRGYKNNRLDDLCRDFGIDNSDRTTHGALLDASLLVKVIAEFHKQDYKIGLDGIGSNVLRTKDQSPVRATNMLETAKKDAPHQAMRSLDFNNGSNPSENISTKNKESTYSSFLKTPGLEKSENNQKPNVHQPDLIDTTRTQKETFKAEETKSTEYIENNSLFSYKGTISKTRFALTNIIALLAFGLLQPLVENSQSSLAITLILLLIQFAILCIAIFASIKRCASIKVSPYIVFWVFVPFAGLILFFYLLFAKESTKPSYNESKARKAALLLFAIPMVVFILSFIAGLRQATNSSHLDDIGTRELQNSPALAQVGRTVPKKSASTQSNQHNQGLNTFNNEPEIITSIVSGHPLLRKTIQVQNTGNSGGSNVFTIVQTYWKDWTCITCTGLDTVKAFSDTTPEEPDVLFFVKQPASQQDVSEGSLRSAFGMSVAKKGFYFNDKRTETPVRTYIDEYEADCSSGQLRRVCTYLYSSYFPEERPFKTIILNEQWFSAEKSLNFLALINNSCQKLN